MCFAMGHCAYISVLMEGLDEFECFECVHHREDSD